METNPMILNENKKIAELTNDQMRKTIEILVYKLCTIYNRELTPKLVDIWVEILKQNLSKHQIIKGMDKIMSQYYGSYMPTPAHFIGLANGSYGTDNPEEGVYFTT